MVFLFLWIYLDQVVATKIVSIIYMSQSETNFRWELLLLHILLQKLVQSIFFRTFWFKTPPLKEE